MMQGRVHRAGPMGTYKDCNCMHHVCGERNSLECPQLCENETWHCINWICTIKYTENYSF